jgi:integrase
MESVLLDAAGHRRSPATMPGYHRGRPPRNKDEEYPADPPTVEEIIAVMRAAGDRPDAHRLRALIVLPWRAGLRISEPLALQESDTSTVLAAVCSCGTGNVASAARSGWTDGLGPDHQHRPRTLEGRDSSSRHFPFRETSSLI